jgi:LAO/AO transport system kinase
MRSVLDRRALGQALTRLANASVAEVLAMAPAQPGGAAHARRIGLTGPPGVGKSSLGGRLALLRAAERRVGLLAIDPTSPRSGGAILGDRIRIDDLVGAGELYVRSLASRTAADGLADNLPELLDAMDEAGFDEIVLETVGVGQAEHAARHQVDTLLLVLHPESGDMVQAMKAGIMELADIYVINKADLAGAPRIAAEIKRVLQITASASNSWSAPVVLTSINDDESIARLSGEIDRHQAWLATSAMQPRRQLERARYRLRNLLERRVAETVAELPPAFFTRGFAQQYGDVLRQLGGSGPEK